MKPATIDLYVYNYYLANWCTHIANTAGLVFSGAHRVFTQKVEMEPTAENVAWFAHVVFVNRNSKDTPIDESPPEGVTITLLGEADMVVV